MNFTLNNLITHPPHLHTPARAHSARRTPCARDDDERTYESTAIDARDGDANAARCASRATHLSSLFATVHGPDDASVRAHALSRVRDVADAWTRDILERVCGVRGADGDEGLVGEPNVEEFCGKF